MAEEGDARGDGNVSRRSLVLLEVFSGEGNFDDWVSHFESVAAVNNWTDEEKLLWLRVRLTGKAHVVYTRLAHETQASYINAKAALRDRFEPSNYIKWSLNVERSRKRKTGLTLLTTCWCWWTERSQTYKPRPRNNWPSPVFSISWSLHKYDFR